MTKRLVVGLPNPVDTDGFLSDICEILQTGIYTNGGPFALRLETEVCRYLGVKYAITVSNATVGLALSLRALCVRRGGEVIVPSFTFAASVHAIVEAGLTPVFCDVNRRTHLMTPEYVRPHVSSNTVAIVAVNLWGMSCGEELEQFAEEKNIPLLFDSAHAFGAKRGDQFIGTFGTINVFSMHATKLFNSFEGGILTTNDSDLARRLSVMRNFGITDQDTFTYCGTNCKLSEPHAAYACRQLIAIENTKAHYRKIVEAYKSYLAVGLDGISLWNEEFLSSGCTHSYICVMVDSTAPFSRDDLMVELRKEGIYAKRYFFPGCHNQPCFAPWRTNKELPNTDYINSRIIILPTGVRVCLEDVQRISGIIKNLHKQAFSQGLPGTSTITVDSTHITARSSFLTNQITLLRSQLTKYELELEAIEK
jgi:dTDP-4-amino-4,6-dideoxygalactose transaminase